MKRIILLAAAALFAGTYLTAGDKKSDAEVTDKKARSEREEGKRPDMQTLTGMADMLKQQLELKDDQYKKIKDIAEKAQKELDAKIEDMKKIAESLDVERAKDSPDLGKAKELMEKRAKNMAEGEFIRFKFTVDCKPVLTAEQTAKWNELRKKMEERIKQARDKKKEK